ncbi:MAG: hypothetical protein ACK4N5_23595, partial [Myxococcales bacterium]
MSDDTLALQFDRSTLTTLPLVRRSTVALPALEVPAGITPELLRLARTCWEERARSEYVGVMIVRRFHGLLVELNAPMDLQEVALLMMLQEQRHAALCVHAAKALGSDGELQFDRAELAQPITSEPLEAQLLEMICGTYLVGEVVALALIRHSIRALPPSPFRGILETIAADEVLHGNLGEQLLCALRKGCDPAWLAWPGDAWVIASAQRTMD